MQDMIERWKEGPCYVIAELGCNHQGDINTALKMVEMAKIAGVDCVKMQKRNMDALNDYSKTKLYEGPNSFGKTYYDHRVKLELSMEDMKKVRDRVKELGMDFSCSCWDKKSIDDMFDLVDFYKLQSADSSNDPLIDYMIEKGKPIVASIGGSSFEQAAKIYSKCNEKGVKLALLHTTPMYPCPFDKINLNNIIELKMGIDCPIGYSGHENGIAVSAAAVALGATIIERHFTLDRTMKGGDHAASLEPDGLKKLVRDIRAVETSLGSFDKQSYPEEIEKLASLNKTRKPFSEQ